MMRSFLKFQTLIVTFQGNSDVEISQIHYESLKLALASEMVPTSFQAIGRNLKYRWADLSLGETLHPVV